MKNIIEQIDERTAKITHLKTGVSCLVDTEDVPRLRMFDWHPSKGSANKYPYMRAKIRIHTGDYMSIYMHRLILSFPDSVVDHADGDGLNNKKSNLRECSQAQNCANKSHSSNSTTGAKGVTPYRDRVGRVLGYKAGKIMNKKYHYLGLYKTIDEAAEAFKAFEKKHYGQFARS